MNDLMNRMSKTARHMLRTSVEMDNESTRKTGEYKTHLIDRADELRIASVALDEWVAEIKIKESNSDIASTSSEPS